VAVFLAELRHRLLDALPDFHSAPWGWDGAALQARAGRRAPELPHQVACDPRVTTLFATWERIGLPLEAHPADAGMTAGLEDPRSLLAQGHHRPQGQLGFSPISVRLYDDETLARRAFVEMVHELMPTRSRFDAHVYRFGPTVARTRFFLGHEDEFRSPVDAAVAQLGPPDEHWWSLTPPLRSPGAEVRATAVRLAPHMQEGRWAYCARTRGELAALVELVQDPDVADVVAGIDPRRHSALLIRGISEVSGVGSTSIVEDPVLDRGEPAVGHHLIVSAEHTSVAIGTLVVVDRLARPLTTLTIRDSLSHGQETVRTFRP
jgi:hypothetical protein